MTDIDYEKMTLLEQLKAGLKQNIAQAKGELTLKTSELPLPPPQLSKTRVVAIRKKLHVSQAVFAVYLNVPTKTVQSWEQGARSPHAGTARLLQLVDAAPQNIVKLIFANEQPQSTVNRRAGMKQASSRKATLGK